MEDFNVSPIYVMPARGRFADFGAGMAGLGCAAGRVAHPDLPPCPPLAALTADPAQIWLSRHDPRALPAGKGHDRGGCDGRSRRWPPA
jgi:hypothetical protein